jgi:glycine oxidase
VHRPPAPPVAHGQECDGRRSHDVVVVGGGVIGLAVAWKAASRGLKVGVADPHPGAGASWVAAGMLAPVTEVHYGEEPLLALNVASARLWPEFVAELERSSGRRVGYMPCGTLVAALEPGDRAWAEQFFAFAAELGLEVQWMSGRQVRQAEPNISPRVCAGMFASGDHQVDNRLLVAALIEAAGKAGCCFHRERADWLDTAGGKVESVRLSSGALLASTSVVVASGAWSADIGGLPEACIPPVRPVKGQILRLRCPDGRQLLARCVRGVVNGTTVYLVPRSGGSVVVGSTVEEKGFDSSVTTGAVYEMLRDAHRVVPGIAELELSEAVAGLRPGSPDNAPMLGPCPGVEGLLVATGHYRNGVLLTPMTAQALAAALCGEAMPSDALPFSPARFQVPSWSR